MTDPQTGESLPSSEGNENLGGRPGRRMVAAVSVLVVTGGIVGAGIVPRLRARAALRSETNDLAVPTVSVIRPQLGAPQTEIILPGNIQAFSDSPIYARTSGYLKKWYVDIGARVAAGQLLAEIETPEVDQQLDQARADLKTAQANLRLAEITAERYQGLLKTEAVSKEDVDKAVGDFDARRAMVASAESNVRRLEQLQSFEKIEAPFDGVITARNTDVGHLIDSGAGGGAATELFHIAATSKLRVFIHVPEQYSQAARPGITADLTLLEFPGRRFQGTLVRTASSFDVATRTLLVEVDIDNSRGELFPGAYAEVHLQAPETIPALILPVSTLIFRSEGMQVATVGEGNRAELRNVTLGRDMGNEVEVVSGLNANASIIVNPPDSLVSGETVRVTTESRAPAESP